MKNKVPKLRFSEFSGEWKEFQLSKIVKFLDGMRKPLKDSERQQKKGKYPYYGASGIIDYIDDYIFEEELILLGEDGANIITRSTRLSFLATGKYWVNNHAHVLKGKENINQYFLCEYLENLNYEKYNTGTAQPKLNQEICKKIIINSPSLPEQEKIANFLSSVDIKIEKLEKKKELLEKYKKGMMQKLFSQKLRFKDENGNDYPEWEEKRLGKISDVRDGTHDSPKYIEKGYPFITSKNLMANGQINFKDINYISKEDYISINKRSQVTKGDILFGMIGTIGNPVIVTKEGFAIKNVALIKEKDNLKNNFLLQLLKSSMTEKQFHVLNVGGTQKFISLGLIRDLKFNLPSLPEQEKIANFLSSIDRKIELIERELEKNREFKKGLLQKMFV